MTLRTRPMKVHVQTIGLESEQACHGGGNITSLWGDAWQVEKPLHGRRYRH